MEGEGRGGKGRLGISFGRVGGIGIFWKVYSVSGGDFGYRKSGRFS